MSIFSVDIKDFLDNPPKQLAVFIDNLERNGVGVIGKSNVEFTRG